MKKTTATALLLAFVLVGVFSCSKSGESCAAGKNSGNGLVPSTVNPNGDSELALLMRAMFDDGKRMKTQLEQGVTPTLTAEFERIHTARPTPGKEPDVETPLFGAFATAYLDALHELENLQEGEPAQNVQKFNHMVTTCMNCHRAICPGPMVRIKQLYAGEVK